MPVYCPVHGDEACSFVRDFLRSARQGPGGSDTSFADRKQRERDERAEMARDVSTAHMETKKKIVCSKLRNGKCRHLVSLGFQKCSRYHTDDELQFLSTTECCSSLRRDKPTRCYFFTDGHTKCPYLNHRNLDAGEL